MMQDGEWEEPSQFSVEGLSGGRRKHAQRQSAHPQLRAFVSVRLYSSLPVTRSVLNTLQVSPHLVLVRALQGGFYYYSVNFIEG